MSQDIGMRRPLNPEMMIGDAAWARTFLFNVYNWMTVGLAITGVIAFFLGNSRTFLTLLENNPFILFLILGLQLVVVLVITLGIRKIPFTIALGGFFFYAALLGVTVASLFLVYTGTSIALTFFVCAAMFGSVSIFGYITKMDLSGMRTYLLMGLVGIIIASLANFFIGSSTLQLVISYVGVVVFVGLTAYDTQKIKTMARQIDMTNEMGKKVALFGALTLYLDFINLFFFLLRILGGRRD